MAKGTKRICLYFGSFNPIHIGHLALARYARDRIGFDEVWLVLSPLNPHKRYRDQLPYSIRAEFVRLSIEGELGIRLCTIEQYLPAPHYTVRSVRALKMLYPEISFSLLIGADNLTSLPQWYESERLQKNVSIYVYPRPGTDLDDSKLSLQSDNIHICTDAPLMEVSSSKIRERIFEGKPIGYMLPRVEFESVLKEQLLALSTF